MAWVHLDRLDAAPLRIPAGDRGFRLFFVLGRAVPAIPQLGPAPRLLLARVVAITVVAVTAVAGAYSVFQGLRDPVVKELRIALPGLPPACREPQSSN